MKILSFLLLAIALSSCSIMQDSLTHQQKLERAKIEHQINTLYNDYSYVSDSLMTEYYNIGKQ